MRGKPLKAFCRKNRHFFVVYSEKTGESLFYDSKNFPVFTVEAKKPKENN